MTRKPKSTRPPSTPPAGPDRRPVLREVAANHTARARWLVIESRRGDGGPWPTLADARVRARLADVASLAADGHHEAAAVLRRTIPPPSRPAASPSRPGGRA